MGISAILDLKKIQQSHASKGNFKYFEAGFEGLVQVTDVNQDFKNVSPGVKGSAYIAVPFKVITSNKTEVGQPLPAPGEIRDYFMGLDQQTFASNFQSLMCALVGVNDVKQIQEPVMSPADYTATAEALFDGDMRPDGTPVGNPGAIGLYVYCRCVGGITQKGPNKGKPNAIPHFSAPTAEQYAAAGVSPDADVAATSAAVNAAVAQ